MGLRFKSPSEDNVDAYTHTWTVFFFLFLAFILLVVPAIPGKQNVTEQQKIKSRPRQELKVNCWCPAYFADSHVAYTNRVCSRKYVSFKEKIIAANFTDQFGDIKIHGSSGKNKDASNSNSRSSSNDKTETRNTKADDDKNDEEHLVRLHSPLILFIMAVALRVPRLFCSILSRCFCSINIGRTLESAEKGDAMELFERKEKYTDLVQAFAKCTRSSQKTATYLYLLMKVLMILVVSAQIVFIYTNILPKLEIQGPSKEESSQPAKAETTLNPPTTQALNLTTNSGLNSTKTPETVFIDDERDVQPKNLEIFQCAFTIRQMTNVHMFEVQCIIEKQTEQPIPTPSTSPPLNPLLFNVFLIALGALVILLVFNAVNTLVWVIGLVGASTRHRVGVSEDSPLDMVLLVLMARTNLSVGVASGLAECARGGKSVKEDGDELLSQKCV